ncbi:hypothetical protein [Streptomyces sp. NPDC058426]|uniref:hypothetical protein n=1 Tax=unclassified Streptomyces TaxID=2593676 RepID=UPI0036680447
MPVRGPGSDTVVREVAEETGCTAVVEHLLGVGPRFVPADRARRPAPVGRDEPALGGARAIRTAK